MSFLSCACRLIYGRKILSSHVQRELRCTIAYLSHKRELIFPHSHRSRTFNSLNYVSTDLQPAFRKFQYFKYCSQAANDVPHQEEPKPTQETENLPMEKPHQEETSIVRTFGPNEYEFDSNGYLTHDQVVKFLQHESGFDICVIEASEGRDNYVDYLIVVSGVSRRHINAMAKNVEQLFRGMRVRGVTRSVSVEGLATDNWLALDIGNMVVHFFLPEARSIYELEKLWTLGTKYDDQYKAFLEEEEFIQAVFVGNQPEEQDEITEEQET